MKTQSLTLFIKNQPIDVYITLDETNKISDISFAKPELTVSKTDKTTSDIETLLKEALTNTAFKLDWSLLNTSQVTPFRLKVYKALSTIPRGQKLSYQELAVKAGCPKGPRAVGNAMAANPFPILIPCHRVVKSDGSIGNYTGGAHLKKLFLEIERE